MGNTRAGVDHGGGLSLHRYAAKRDATEKAIVDALRAVGADVLHLDKFDLLVQFRGRLFMLDPKSRTGRPTKSQRKLTAEGWPLHYVETPEAALKVIGAVSGSDVVALYGVRR